MCSLKFQLALNSTEMPEDSSQVPTLLLTSICEQLKHIQACWILRKVTFKFVSHMRRVPLDPSTWWIHIAHSSDMPWETLIFKGGCTSIRMTMIFMHHPAVEHPARYAVVCLVSRLLS